MLIWYTVWGQQSVTCITNSVQFFARFYNPPRGVDVYNPMPRRR